MSHGFQQTKAIQRGVYRPPMSPPPEAHAMFRAVIQIWPVKDVQSTLKSHSGNKDRSKRKTSEPENLSIHLKAPNSLCDMEPLILLNF